VANLTLPGLWVLNETTFGLTKAKEIKAALLNAAASSMAAREFQR
jgi:hypothetical protein